MMKLANKIKTTLTMTLTLAALGACSHGPAVQEFADTASPKDEVSRLDAEVANAQAAQVDVLAPESFKEARDSLGDARKSLDKQKDARDTLHAVAEGRAYLNRANDFAKLAHANIEDVVVARKQALAAGAPALYGDDFKSADADLTDATSRIEKNDLADAIENRGKLQLAYLDLELRSIKQASLGKSRDNIKLAIKEDAKDHAPRSLALAEKSVLDTDAFITGNRHDTAQISKRSAVTLATSEHLLKISRESRTGKKTSNEDLALQMESETLKTGAKQAQLNDKQKQLDAKQGQLDIKQGELASKQDEIAAGETANMALQAKNSDLESEKALDRRYEEARAEFTQGEAEVYKQGDTLMIRLRGLEFPTSQALLKGSNFPLLAKVQKVIRDFGESSVVVEGHTDSNGGKALNERLSSERAEAVKDYLSSNLGATPASVSAIGYGYQKPLATNKTASGRAQNRRVDVLIQPKS
jgi:outer membrane protein OmpA-like peptidoglycan-associated protein